MKIILEQIRPLYVENKTLASIDYLLSGYEVKFIVSTPTASINRMTLGGTVILDGTKIDTTEIEERIKELINKTVNDPA